MASAVVEAHQGEEKGINRRPVAAAHILCGFSTGLTVCGGISRRSLMHSYCLLPAVLPFPQRACVL